MLFRELLGSTRDKDRHKDRDKDRQRRHRPPHGKKTGPSTREQVTAVAEADVSSSSTSTTSSTPRTINRRSSMPDVESIGRSNTASFLESRTSLPYPTFSKPHSKEAIWDNEGLERKLSILTPDPTDLTDGKGPVTGARRHKARVAPRRNSHNAPPSPPLTADQQSSRKGSAGGVKVADDEDGVENTKEPKAKIQKTPSRPTSSASWKKDEASKAGNSRPSTPIRSKPHGDLNSPSRSASYKTSSRKLRETIELPKRSTTYSVKSPPRSFAGTTETASESTNDSDSTSIAPNQSPIYRRLSTDRPLSRNHDPNDRRPPSIEIFLEEQNGLGISTGTPVAPPPPPPPQMPISVPRVDYLLQHGGLNYRVPKHLLGADESVNMPEQLLHPQTAVVKVFEPFNRLLDDYSHVITKNGSLAVATGYKSVARRLLDRLEAVFARDISSETCLCPICQQDENHQIASGVSWGEVLELVSGRRELPSWPPFRIAPAAREQVTLDEEHIPMQKLDIDVPEEFREHYIRQSRKIKQAVDKWLLSQNEQNLPDEVDDGTLSFAMMTYLDPEQQRLFSALLGIRESTPAPRTDTPQPQARPEPLTIAAIAIQRVYRLSTPPRDSEVAMYMLTNPHIHNVLATLAAISNDEWEILISGRFDGFLRSGAEDNLPPLTSASAPPRAGSRSSTPFTPNLHRRSTPSQSELSFRPKSQPYGANPSPATYGAPIGLDEENEIAALAEIERDIYLTMEALEDSFEALHRKAEVIRHALRERGAGLSFANQARRGTAANLDARLGTPASLSGSTWSSGVEDDGIDDEVSLAPDDSASNISSNRRRRPKRRNERRTPALVEEEDEEDGRYDGKGSKTRP